MTSVSIALATMPPGRRLVLYASATAAVLMLLVLGSAAVLRFSVTDDATGRADTTRAGTDSPAPVVVPGRLTASLTPADQAAILNDVARIRAMPDVRPGTSSQYPAIPVDRRQQPDLYARAFATQLLTQDYRGSRAELLAWVQAESAASSEPTVIGLVPVELRGRLAVWSVVDAPDGARTPIPSETEWAAWARRNAYTTVAVTRVSTPVKWAAAVGAGQLTDPGITSRSVDAQVTTHWRDGKAEKTFVESVTLAINLEGPPSRAGYGFVDAVTFDAVEVN